VALVLAIESDLHQAGILERIVREEVPADLVVSDSKDTAIASIAERLPDLILVSALMSPREEAELTEHLRGLEDADHLQTLTIPLFASKPVRRSARGKMLRALKWRHARSLEGCDPSVFAEEIRGYLERARDLRAQRALERGTDEDVAVGRDPDPAASETDANVAVTEHRLSDQADAPLDAEGPPSLECHDAPAAPLASETLEGEDAVAQAPDKTDLVDPDVLLLAESPMVATPISEAPPAWEPAPVDQDALLVESQLVTPAPPVSETPEVADAAAQAPDKTDFVDPDVLLVAESPVAATSIFRAPPAWEPVPVDQDAPLVESQLVTPAPPVSETPEVGDAAAQAPDIIELVDPDVPPGIEPHVSATPTLEGVASEVSKPIDLLQASPERTSQRHRAEWPAGEDADSRAAAPTPPVTTELTEAARQDGAQLAGEARAFQSHALIRRAKRVGPRPTPPVIRSCARPVGERIPIGQAAPPPARASSGERVLKLVKTGKRGSSRRRPTAPFEPSPALPDRQPAQFEQPPPIQDEWAIHDPRECGFGALFARLDAASAGDSASGKPKAREGRGTRRRNGRPGKDKEISARTAPPRSRKRRVTPLAIWARVEADELEIKAGPDDLRALFASLSLPPGIASVSYPTGCRIRRIRVSPPARLESAIALGKEPIILSRRLLHQLQQRDNASRAEGQAL
jgi:hypothetical protein